jgi:uncharacterized membrane protein YbhN (UPF0104 family)
MPSIPRAPEAPRWRAWYAAARPYASVALTALIAWLLFAQLRAVDWGSVVSIIGNYPLASLAWAAVLTAVSHAVYCCFDLLGRRRTGHRLPAREVLRAAFVSYGFGLNLGVAGVGFRFRVYRRLGLHAAMIARLWAVCVATNWLGYAMLAGALFASGLIAPPAEWRISGLALRWLGAGLLAVALVYLAMCATSQRRSWHWRGHTLTLPSLRFAFTQSMLGALNWTLIGGVMFVLLQQHVPYEVVLGVLLVSAIAHAAADVPGGMGVTEGVFVALLGTQMPMAELLAGLLAFRALYYLVPMLPAGLAYLAFEAQGPRPEAA